MMTCSKCFRLNNSDARFCDWCGVQPERVLIPIQCTKCQANNDPHAKFCSTCGCVIDPRIRNDLTIPASSMIASVC
jgi:ribosomal protein L40E